MNNSAHNNKMTAQVLGSNHVGVLCSAPNVSEPFRRGLSHKNTGNLNPEQFRPPKHRVNHVKTCGFPVPPTAGSPVGGSLFEQSGRRCRAGPGGPGEGGGLERGHLVPRGAVGLADRLWRVGGEAVEEHPPRDFRVVGGPASLVRQTPRSAGGKMLGLYSVCD